MRNQLWGQLNNLKKFIYIGTLFEKVEKDELGEIIYLENTGIYEYRDTVNAENKKLAIIGGINDQCTLYKRKFGISTFGR